MTKSLPTYLDTEQLLKSLDSTNTTIERKILYDIHPFLQKYNISYGNNYIPSSLFYLLYTLNTNTLITQEQFELETKELFPHSLDLFHSIEYFHLNVSKEIITEHIISLYKSVKKNYNKRTVQKDELKDHFNEFIEKFNLKPGDLWLESYVLYELYDRFAYRVGKKNPLGLTFFSMFSKNYFPNKKQPRCRVFGVDNSIMQHITQDQIDLLRASRKKQHVRKTKRKKKLAKEREISES